MKVSEFHNGDTITNGIRVGQLVDGKVCFTWDEPRVVEVDRVDGSDWELMGVVPVPCYEEIE